MIKVTAAGCSNSNHWSKSCVRRTSTRMAAAGPDISHMLQQEVTIEGVLHLSAAQAGSCMERWGNIDALSAPALPPLEDVLAATSDGRTPVVHTHKAHPGASTASILPNEQVISEALCLATPSDDPSETFQRRSLLDASTSRMPNREGYRSLWTPRQIRANSSVTLPEEDEAWLEEGVYMLNTYQHAAVSAQAMYTSEVLQASAAIRRQRRRALVRLLREGRARTSASLAALQDSPAGQVLHSMRACVAGRGDLEDISSLEGPQPFSSDDLEQC